MPDSQMQEWKTCEDGSPENLLFISTMEALESVCESKFEMFKILGYQEVVGLPETFAGKLYETKI